VEAAVFMVDGTLRVGHDRAAASRGGSLDSLYLRPLAAVAARCRTLTADGTPFVLLVEAKERSMPTYNAILSLLASRFPGTRGAMDGGGAIEVVMMGWTPMGGAVRPMHQHRIDGLADTIGGPGVRLVSLDHGKTMGRWWRTAAGRRRRPSTLRAARRANPALLLRVHNAPVDARLCAELPGAGVDLLGTKDPAATRAALMATRR
jgi:hypothetical protein